MSDQSNAPYPPAAPQPYQPYPAQKSGTNVLAIVSLIGAFVFALAGVICGHIALSQIKRTGESGRGLAIAGLVIGYAAIAFYILLFIIVIAAGLAASSSGYSTY